MSGGLALALLALASATPLAEGGVDNLRDYRELQTAALWTRCCGAFPAALPKEVERRIGNILPKLESRYGKQAVLTAAEEARKTFEEEFGLYDPAPRRRTAAQKRAEQRRTLEWYDARLDALEVRLRGGK